MSTWPSSAADRGELELWARCLEERGLARATISRRLSTVSGFYRICVLDGLVEHSRPSTFTVPPSTGGRAVSTTSATCDEVTRTARAYRTTETAAPDSWRGTSDERRATWSPLSRLRSAAGSTGAGRLRPYLEGPVSFIVSEDQHLPCKMPRPRTMDERQEVTMSDFTAAQLAYLRAERRLGRVATVGKDGIPHVAPVGWSCNDQRDTIDVGGRQFAQTKKYRDVKRSGRAAIVIDDLARVDP